MGLHNSNSFVLASQLEMMSLTINWNQFVGQRDPGIHLLPTYLFQLPTPPLCFLGIQEGKPPWPTQCHPAPRRTTPGQARPRTKPNASSAEAA